MWANTRSEFRKNNGSKYKRNNSSQAMLSPKAQNRFQLSTLHVELETNRNKCIVYEKAHAHTYRQTHPVCIRAASKSTLLTACPSRRESPSEKVIFMNGRHEMRRSGRPAVANKKEVRQLLSRTKRQLLPRRLLEQPQTCRNGNCAFLEQIGRRRFNAMGVHRNRMKQAFRKTPRSCKTQDGDAPIFKIAYQTSS